VTAKTATKRPDIGATFSVPASLRITKFLNVSTWLLASNKVARVVWQIPLSVAVAWALTTESRDDVGTIAGIALVAVVWLCLDSAGAVAIRLWQRPQMQTWLFGRPEYGVLGGARRNIFRFVLRSHAGMELRFNDAEAAIVNEADEIGRDVSLVLMRANYDAAVERGDIDPSEFDYAAAEAEMLNREVNGTTARETIEQSLRSWGLGVPRIETTSSLVFPLIAIYSVVVAFLVVRAAFSQGTPAVLLAAQVALLGSFVVGFVIYANYVFAYAEIILAPEWIREREAQLMRSTAVPDELRERQEAFNAEHGDRVLRPQIVYGPPYVRAVRDFFAPPLVKVAAVNGCVFLVACLVALAADALVGEGFSTDPYIRIVAGLALVPVALLAGLMLAFGVLQNISRFASLFVASAVLAVLPPLLTFLIQGKLADPQVTLTASVITGVIGAAATAAAESLKRPTQPPAIP
jgi:hypothetical protein